MYVDADILLGVIKPEDRHKQLAEKILSSKEKQYTSVVTLIELEFVLGREISKEAGIYAFEIFKKAAPKVKLTELDEAILSKSFELRNLYEIGVLDSIHAATALSEDKRIASTDKVFDRIPELTRVF